MTGRFIISQQLHRFVAGSEDRIEHRLVRVERRVLRQVSHDALVSNGRAASLGLLACRNDSQQGGFARAVQSYQTDFVAVVEAEGHAFKQLPRAVAHADVFERDDSHSKTSCTPPTSPLASR